MGAFFLMLDNNRSGGEIDFKTIKINTALAKRVLLSRTSHLIFGLGVEYQQFGLSLDGFTTSSQFVEGIGFDPGLSNGESSGFYKVSYIAINSGLFFRKTNFRQTRLLQIGVSAHNLNRQLKTWGEQGHPLPVQWSSQLQFLALTNYNFAAGPDIQVFKEGSNMNGTGGLSLRYYLKNPENIILPEENQSSLNFFARVATQGKGILGIQYTNGKFMAGVGYDLPFGNLIKVYDNAFEVLFALTPRVGSPDRNRRNRFKSRRSGTERKPKQENLIVEKRSEFPPGQSGDFLESDSTGTTKVISADTEGHISAGGIISEHIDVTPVVTSLYFISGSSRLDTSSREFLEKVFDTYLKNGEYRIILTGHTDSVGKPNDNLELSLQRARAAASYLGELGLSGEYIEVKGRGEEEPLVPNDTMEGRARNRRVEIKLVPK